MILHRWLFSMLTSRRQRLIARKAPATTAGRVAVPVDSQEVATKPGDKYRSLQRPDVYRALRRKRGMSKEAAARISNAQAPGHTVKVGGNSAGRVSDLAPLTTPLEHQYSTVVKASPTRTLDAGRTSVAVMLLPSLTTVQQLATLPGVTEAPDTLHLTLCYLGKVDEVPLLMNKERIVNALLQWAALHNSALHGPINGVGRFYSTEDDDTNAVYVSPDLAGLPDLRWSLIQWIEQMGLEYARDHGFTPHVTVAYVPADDPTPPIRVNIPACFDRLLLAWGDEQYEVPLLENDQAQYAGETMEDWDDGLGTPAASPEAVVAARGQFAAALGVPTTYTTPDGATWLLASKAPNYGARAGQVIIGGLARADDGKFTNAGSGSTSDAAPAPKKGKQPKKTAAARESEREAKRAARIAERDAARDAAYRKLNIAPDGQAAMEALRRGESADADAVARAGLEDAGLVERDSDGKYHLTASGRATVNAASRGDTGRAGDTIAGARDRLRARRERTQERERKKRERDAKRQEQAAGKALFTVFKDARGQWRWIGLTSNGYEDRDAEYVSVKALSADVARADADGRYGPLRWWHMGSPDPTNAEAPWGPGVDLGWCDFNAMSGPFLVESGTFVSEKVARAIAPITDQLGLSPGFFHPRPEPTAGVFHTIRRFERSLAPRAAVSNRFTTFSTITKERRMDAAKLKELAEMSGLDDGTIASLITGAVETRQKEASAEGVRLKTQDAPAVYIGPDGEPGIIQNGAFVALKAARPPEDVPPAAMAPSGKAEVEEVVAEEEGGEDEGPLLLDADLDAIADRVFAKISPLLDIEKKMRGYADEVKSHFSGMAQKTASTDAAMSDHATRLKAAETALEKAQASLAELRGDAPAIVQRGGFSASTDPATALHAQIGQMMTGKAAENGTPPQGKAAETLEWFVRGLTTGNPDGAAPQTPPNI